MRSHTTACGVRHSSTHAVSSSGSGSPGKGHAGASPFRPSAGSRVDPTPRCRTGENFGGLGKITHNLGNVANVGIAREVDKGSRGDPHQKIRSIRLRMAQRERTGGRRRPFSPAPQRAERRTDSRPKGAMGSPILSSSRGAGQPRLVALTPARALMRRGRPVPRPQGPPSHAAAIRGPARWAPQPPPRSPPSPPRTRQPSGTPARFSP